MSEVTSRLRLVVDSSGLDKAGKKLKDLQGDARRADEIAAKLKSAFLTLGAVVGAAFSAVAIVKFSDSWKRVENQLKTVEKSFAGVRSAQEGVFAVAQKTFSSFDATAALYTKLTRAGGGLINGQKEALRLVETVNKALAVGGASASERSSVILQLGQAVGSGRLQGDEFRSISENAPMLLDAIAKSTGKARGELKQLGSEGKITSEVLIKALKEYGDEVDATFGKFTPTIADAFTKLQNAFEKFVGENGSTLFNGLAAGISLLADNLDLVAKAAIIATPAMVAMFSPQIVAAIGGMVNGVKALGVAIASNPIGAIATVLATAAVAFYEFSDSMKVATADGGKFVSHLDGLKGEVIEYSVTVQDVLKEIPGFIADVFHGLTKSTGAYLKTAYGPDALDQIGVFFKGALEISKRAINIMIGLWVGLGPAIVATLYNLPGMISEVFTKALNSAGSAVTNFVNQNRASINGLLQAVALVTHIPVPEIPELKWTPLVSGASGAAKAVGEAWKGVFNTDYVGGTIKTVLHGFDQLRERAEATKRASAEQAALASKAAGATGGGLPGADEAAADANKVDKALQSLRDTLNGYIDDAVGGKPFEVTRDQLAKASASVTKYMDAFNRMKAQERVAAAARTGNFEVFQHQLDVEKAMVELRKELVVYTAQELEDRVDMLKTQRTSVEISERELRTAERLYSLTKNAAAERAGEDTLRVTDGFWFDFLKHGKDALKSLGENLEDIVLGGFADGLRSAAEPFTQWFAAQMKASVSDLFDGVKSAMGAFGKDGQAGKGILGWLQGGLDKVFGAGKTAQYAAGLVKGAGAFVAGQGLLQATGLNGSSAAKQQNSQVGSAIGTAVGMMIPVIGPIVGSLVGGFFGGLLGPSKSWNTAQASLDASGGLIGSIGGSKRTAETEGALGTAIQAVGASIKSLTELGASLGVTISELYLGNYGGSVKTSSGVSLATGASAGDLANVAMSEVLRNATFASQALNQIKDGMLGAGKSFDDTYVVLTQVDAVLKSTQPALSQWQQQLKSIDDTFKPLIATTGAYSAALQQAYDATKAALAASFNDEIASQLAKLTTPLAAQFADMLKVQTGRVADATKLGADLARVQALNEAEMAAFFDGIASSATGLSSLTTEIQAMMAAAQAAGQDVAGLATALDRAKATIKSTFDADIADGIKGLLNGPTDQLNDMLAAQAKRLEEAKALGGNLDQVNRLTALEQREFFKGLSEDALKEVSDFLGLFDEATNSVVRNLDLSRQDLRARADSFSQFAEQFTQLSSDLTQKYQVASPRESIGTLRGRVQDLLGGVAQGNDSAAQALPQVINQLVEAARQTFGNTGAFTDILTFAQGALAQGKESALKVQSDAEKQIAALDANNDILGDIRDILASSQAANAYFQSYLSGGVASSDALLSLIQQGAGMSPANDNASALNITGLIAQSVQPIIMPLAASIDSFTERLADLPSLQRLTIEAIDRGSDRIVDAIDRLDDRMDRIEILTKKQLEELEQANTEAA